MQGFFYYSQFLLLHISRMAAGRKQNGTRCTIMFKTKRVTPILPRAWQPNGLCLFQIRVETFLKVWSQKS